MLCLSEGDILKAVTPEEIVDAVESAMRLYETDEFHMPDRMQVDYDGPDAQIAFNPELIEDALGMVEREAVKIRFTDRRSPCVLKSGLDYTYVVSPVIREESQ